MDSNRTILILIGIITALLVLPRLNNISAVVLMALIFIGYGITKDYVLALSVASVIIYIFIFLNTSSSKTKSTIESFKTKKKKRRKKKKRKVQEPFGFDDNSEDFSEHQLDTKQSFLENYKTLTPKQIKGLNRDTKELIRTQKALIDTLNNMGPTLKEGKNVLDTFKNYFGNDMDLGKLKV